MLVTKQLMVDMEKILWKTTATVNCLLVSKWWQYCLICVYYPFKGAVAWWSVRVSTHTSIDRAFPAGSGVCSAGQVPTGRSGCDQITVRIAVYTASLSRSALLHLTLRNTAEANPLLPPQNHFKHKFKSQPWQHFLWWTVWWWRKCPCLASASWRLRRTKCVPPRSASSWPWRSGRTGWRSAAEMPYALSASLSQKSHVRLGKQTVHL